MLLSVSSEMEITDDKKSIGLKFAYGNRKLCDLK